METTNTSSSPLPSTTSLSTSSSTPQSSTGDIAAPPMRVFRLIRPNRETLIRGTQTSSPPSEPSTSAAASSSETVPEQTDYPENPRKVDRCVILC